MIEGITSIVALLDGSADAESDDGCLGADAVIARLPVALALSTALVLARSGATEAALLAESVYAQLHPLAGRELKVDDELAKIALALGRPSEAIAVLEPRLEASVSLAAYQELARAYLDAGRPSDATALAGKLTSERGDKLTTWLIAGEVFLNTDEIAWAKEAYEQALRMTPTATRAQLGLALCAAAEGAATRAHTLVRRALATYPGAPSVWALRQVAVIAARLGNEAWGAEIAASLAEQEAREAETLRAQLSAALALGEDDGSGGMSGRWRYGMQPVSRARGGRTALAEEAWGKVVPIEVASSDEATVAETPLAEEEPAPELLTALREIFGYERFLPGQATILNAVLRGDDVLALMPTGAGKSLCYQLPALLLPGTTLLISPLIALMKDQIDGLPEEARDRATVINSLVEREEMERRLAGIAAGNYKLVYAAPERLRQQSFLHALKCASVTRFVVDEAHCVSLWGHDFRPDYLFIAKALAELSQEKRVPVLALTATATLEVRESIAEALGRELLVVNRGVFRPNLRYEVQRVHNNEDRLKALAEVVRATPGSGIVYVRSRDGCEEVAEFLRRRCGVRARYYHAGMERAEREEAQNAWITGHVRIVVATVAFGMGINKPDVRLLVHFQLPGSLEAYAQESGRAGRDGLPSRCVLFASRADIALLRRHVRQDELAIETLRHVYTTTRALVRTGAPAGASMGRVASADLEREVTSALRTGQDSGGGARQIDETVARVAVSLLERAGYLRRYTDVPRAASVRLLRGVAGASGGASYHAFIAAARLRPGQSAMVDLVALAAELNQLPAALEEDLLGWRDAGLVEYRDGLRDLLLEIPPAPVDSKTALPTLLATLGDRHERQIESLVAYTQSSACRQRSIAAHFGERLPVPRCGVCDTCVGSPAGKMPGRRAITTQASRIRDDASLRETMLACLVSLPYAVGTSGLIRILRGSENVAATGRQLPQFGALAAASEARLKREIEALVSEHVLIRDDSGEYPLLRLAAGASGQR